MKLSGSEATVVSRDPKAPLKEIRAALEREPRVRFDRHPIEIIFNENACFVFGVDKVINNIRVV